MLHTEIGKITAKGQTTIPAIFRRELKLEAGDEIVFIRENDTLTLRKAQPIDVAYYRAAQSTLAEEWLSPEDAEAYDHL